MASAAAVTEDHHHHSHHHSSHSHPIGEEHHVKFNLQEDEVKSHHENLEIKEIAPFNYGINLGYLKIDHYYKVVFTIKLNSSEYLFNYQVDRSSKAVQFKEIKIDEDIEKNMGIYTFMIIFYASKEKHDLEKVFFRLENRKTLADQTGVPSDGIFELDFEAKVLGAHQGTPLLRNGITLLSQHSSHHNINSLDAADKSSHFNIN